MNAMATAFKAYLGITENGQGLNITANESVERVDDKAAAFEMGIDLWDLGTVVRDPEKDDEIDEKENREDRKKMIDESIKMAKCLAGEKLVDFIIELEDYYNDEPGKWKGKGAEFVKHYILEPGNIILPY